MGVNKADKHEDTVCLPVLMLCQPPISPPETEKQTVEVQKGTRTNTLATMDLDIIIQFHHKSSGLSLKNIWNLEFLLWLSGLQT